MYRHKITNHLEKVRSEIAQITNDLHHCPKGHLSVLKNGKYFRYVHVTDGSRSHISKKNTVLLSMLAKKMFLSARLSDLLQEEKSLMAYLNCYGDYQSKVEQLITEPLKKDLLRAYPKPLSEDLAEWQASGYEANPAYPEALRHHCISGNMVRSKSEVFIDQRLYLHQIPYRYEAPLQLGDTTLYPDFTIRHPQTGKTFYWEHFGLMDDPRYAQNAFHKMNLYNRYGILPSVHLITTFENHECPLNIDIVEEIICRYFT